MSIYDIALPAWFCWPNKPMELFWLVVAPNPGVLVAPKAGVAVVAPNAGVVVPKRPPLWVVAVPKGLLNVLLCWLAWPKSPNSLKNICVQTG